ncbi:MAG: hypothetical protein ACE15F_17815 [bacterium]
MKKDRIWSAGWAGRLAAAGIYTAVSGYFVMATGAGTVNIEKIDYLGWKNCYRMSNGEVELIAVADVGPRLIHFGFVGGRNVLFVDPQTAGKTGGDTWVSYGGHRLWVAPELVDVTYYPDNFPVTAEIAGNKLTLTAPPEVTDPGLRAKYQSNQEILQQMEDPAFRKSVKFMKQMIVTMSEAGEVTIEHKITNGGLKTETIAPWALSVMTAGGLGIFSTPPYAPHGPGHFLPEQALFLWSYTDLTDPRMKYMKKYITFQQDPAADKPIKFGFSQTRGWTGYALGDQLFVKKLDYYPGETYPDMGASVEIFTNRDMMEIESLGPVVNLKPGETTYHRERWQLFRIEPVTQTEESIDQVILPLKLGS